MSSTPSESPALPSTAALKELGRAARHRLPRRELAMLTTAGRHPAQVLDAQETARVPELLPLRHERMAASPFAFYRGTAALMAADLARDPHSGILVASCGDAHVANFGFYASPERSLVFDLNDFDEAAVAPWEWDVKRLVTSVVVAGRAAARDDAAIRHAALLTVRAYVRALRHTVRLSPVQRYFQRVSAESLDAVLGAELDEVSLRHLRRARKDAARRSGARAAPRLTRPDEHGRLRFVAAPPTMVPLPDGADEPVRRLLREYRSTTLVDIATLLVQYRLADLAVRVVGVGSVGTRCHLALLQDGDGRALILQTKEAGRSVLEEYGGIEQPAAVADQVNASGQGARVVALQRVLQASSDPFLGHLRADGRDHYVRQFHDMKGGIDTEELEDEPFLAYAQACAVVLARAHAQSPTAASVAGYVGKGDAVAEAVTDWAYRYADVSVQDHRAFVDRLAAR